MGYLKGLLFEEKFKVKYFWKRCYQFPRTSVALLSVFFLFCPSEPNSSLLKNIPSLLREKHPERRCWLLGVTRGVGKKGPVKVAGLGYGKLREGLLRFCLMGL